MAYNYLLNKIELKNGKSFIGIVDYITTKQLYFFDFTNEKYIDYILLAILWKGNYDNMRFSVFCAINFPNIDLPRVILLPQSNIEDIDGMLPEFDKPKQKKRIIKNL